MERPFDHALDGGGMRRVHLKGRRKVAKRYLIQTATFNLGLIMRKLTGFGTPKGWADGLRGRLLRFANRLRAAWRRDRLLSQVFRPIFPSQTMSLLTPRAA